MFSYLFSVNFKRFRRYYRTRTVGKIFTTVLFAAVFLAVAWGIYEFFLKGFQYLNTYLFFRTALTLYAFELFFLLLAFLAWLSSSITLLFALFRNKPAQLFLVSPQFQLAPAAALWKTFSASVLMFLFVLVPTFWAAAVVFHLNGGLVMLSLIAGILLLAFVVVLSYGVIMLAAWILRLFQRVVSFRLVSLLVVLVTLALFFFVGNKVSRHNVVDIFNAENLMLGQAPIQPVLEKFSYLPTSLAAQTAGYTLLKHAGAVWTSLSKLVFLLIITSCLGWVLSRRFLFFWQQLSEGSRQIVEADQKKRMAQGSASRKLKTGFGAVVYKEFVLLFRNSRNGYWLVFLIVLWLAYTVLTFGLQRELAAGGNALSTLPNIILSVQLLILVYFLSSFVLRFVFPSFSSERNTAWIFSSSPLSLAKLLWAKFSFFSVVFTAFVIVAELINISLLRLPAGRAGMFLLLSIAAAIFISALGLYFGAAYPNFETDDPQALGTTVPGLVFVLASIVYGALGTYFYYLYVVRAANFPIAFIFALLSIAGALGLIRAAAATVKHIDFVPARD